MDTSQAPDIIAVFARLSSRLESAAMPSDLKVKAYDQLQRAATAFKYAGQFTTLDVTEKYIDFITRLPWQSLTTDTLDMTKAKEILDKNHYGLEKIKSRILEYLAIIALQKKQNPTAVIRAPSLFFVGLAGTGKTTFASSIAEALGRKFIRIPFGGLANALDLRGQSRISPYASPGLIMRSIADCGSRNPVILLDELDRANPDDRSSIMGTLLEILDPSQSSHFTDYFIDYPFDLSQVLFVATANKSVDVATAVLDRLELIQMPSYTDNDKIEIGKRYILPHLLAQSGLSPSSLVIDEAVWPKLVRPLGYEPGIRSLERTLEEIVRRVAYRIVSGQGTTYTITEANMREFAEGAVI